MRRAVLVLAALGMLTACQSVTGRVLPPSASAPQLPGTSALAATHAAPSQTTTAPPTTTASQTTTASPTTTAPSARTVVERKLAAIARRLPAGSISVAGLDTATGTGFHWGATSGMWTGSVYKLLVLETLLLERQHAGSWFSEDELEDITAMIEQSRNKAGYRMYLDAGGATALAATARRLGMRHTHIGYGDPTFTTMNARDGLALLKPLVGNGPLDARSRSFVLGLMRNVESDQRWGVGVVADRGSPLANKNGWLHVDNDNGPGEDDDGRWLVNSLGIVRVHGHQVLLAIFTQHNPDCYTGIDLVERLARLITPAITG